MIKCNIARMVDYPIHTAVLVMDLALLVALGPPLLLSLVMVGGLVWLTIFFTTMSERSDKLRIVWEPAPEEAKPAAAKPAAAAVAAAAPTVSAPAPKPAAPAPAPAPAPKVTATVTPKPAAPAPAKPAVAPAPAAKAKPAAPRKPVKKG